MMSLTSSLKSCKLISFVMLLPSKIPLVRPCIKHKQFTIVS